MNIVGGELDKLAEGSAHRKQSARLVAPGRKQSQIPTVD
jgi:hypothetical protein